MRKISALLGWVVVVGVLLFVFGGKIRNYYNKTVAIQKGVEQTELLVSEIDGLVRVVEEDVRTLNFAKLQEDLGLTKDKLNELIALSEEEKDSLNTETQKQLENYKKAREAIELIQQGVTEKNYGKIGEGVDLIKKIDLAINE